MIRYLPARASLCLAAWGWLCPLAAQQASLANGSFESGFDSWTVSGNVSIENAPPYAPTDGTKLAAFNAVNSTPNGVISQVVTIPNSTSRYHRLRFDVGNLGYVAIDMKLRLEITEVGFGSPVPRINEVITIPGITGGATRWRQASYDFRTPASGQVEIKLTDVSTGTANADLVLDHLRIDDSVGLSVRTSEDTPYPGPFVTVSPASIEGTTSAISPIHVNYHAGDTVTLSAPGFLNLKPFLRWQKNGVDDATLPTTNLTLNADTTMVALYDPPLSLRIETSTEARSFARTGPFTAVSWSANIQNWSGAPVEWSATTAVPAGSADPVFLKVVPSHGVLGPTIGESLRVFLTDEARSLPAGIHRCRLDIHSPFTTASAEIKLTVIEPEQFLENSSFEDGFNGWQTQGHVSLQSAIPYVPTFGTHLVAFNAVNSTPDGTLSQIIPTEPGVTYQLSFDMGVVAFNTSEQRLKVEASYPADIPSPFFSTTLSMNGLADGLCHWDRKVLSFTATGDFTQITFTDVSPATSSIDLLLDTVVVRNPYFNLMVTTSADENDPSPGTGSGDSLRETINRANSIPGSHHIYFQSSVEGHPITITGNELHVTTPIAINSWDAPTTISGNGHTRVFNLGADCLLNNLTIENGSTANSAGEQGGAGILASADLMLSHVAISNNHSPATGAGVFSTGDLVATACQFQSNQAGSSGGALFTGGNALLESSIVYGNSASANGGALANRGGLGSSWLVLSRTTASNNTSGGAGGAYAGLAGYKSSGTLYAENSTFSANHANLSGGAILAANIVNLNHCTVSNNTATAPDAEGGGVAGAGLVVGNSIISNNTAASHPDLASGISGLFLTEFAPNLIGDTAFLSPLGDHGGPTPTMVPGFDSPAIDAATAWGTFSTDQRGYPRNSGVAADLGAVEIPQILVNTLVDENNGLTTGGVSLREAVAAQTTTSSELIRFDPALNGGTIVLGGTSISWLGLLGPYPMIDAGNLPDGIVISGNHQSQIFNLIFSSAWLRGLTLTASSGSAIEMFIGHLDLIDCVFRGNSTAANGAALGIYDSYNTSANIVHCTFENNSASGRGGAIFNEGITWINDSTFAGNHADGKGGAISTGIYHSGMVIRNSTFSGNSADGGGAIEAGSLRLIHSTVSGNSAGAAGGGGIFSNSTTGVPDLGVTLTNSIVSGNTGPGGFDIVGPIDALYGGNLVGGNPKLAPLGDYGGPVLTMPPLPGSPAIEGAIILPAAPPLDGSSYQDLQTDQRGAARPAGVLPDIGAVEAFPFSSIPLVDSDGDQIDDRLEPSYGLTVGVNDSGRDSDGDGSTDAEEIANMTDLNDASSQLKILALVHAPGFNEVSNRIFDVTFSSFPGLSYSAECDPGFDFHRPETRTTPPVIADDFTETLRVTLLPDRDFVRVRRNP